VERMGDRLARGRTMPVPIRPSTSAAQLKTHPRRGRGRDAGFQAHAQAPQTHDKRAATYAQHVELQATDVTAL
jgi:hypothetical protein